MSISNNEETLQYELYSSEQMEIYAKVLSKSHKLNSGKNPDKLLEQLSKNEKTLLDVHKQLVEKIKSYKDITPAGEWLLDNFYLIEEQMAATRRHLPKKYSEELPCLAEGVSIGMPRVYGIIHEMISHSDGRVDKNSLFNFISAYQTNTTLSIGELWAIPIMLRLGIIVDLCRISKNISFYMKGNDLSKLWANRMIKAAKEEPGSLILVIADMVRSKPELTSAFVAGFIRKIQGRGAEFAFVLDWLEKQLLEMGSSGSDIIREENQKQASDQVSMRNCIGTLRFLDSMDWAEFVEKLSNVEKILIQDRAGIYPLMDFETRDKFRGVIELLSKVSKFSETEVAQKVLELTQKNNDVNKESQKEKHVGYYLIDKGLNQTEKAINTHYSLKYKIIHSVGKKTLWVYLFSITLLTFAISFGMFSFAYSFGSYSFIFLFFLSVLLIISTSQFAVSLVNWISTICIKPTFLPKLDFSKGVPSECRTLVVVPTMLLNKKYIKELISDLEIRFLSNSDPNLHFGLITDFKDAESEIMPEDDALLNKVSVGIKELNEKYKEVGKDIFFLFHRPRIWNEMEKRWMGYERKRGKLSALNSFILEGKSENFSLIIADQQLISKVKYVITLDSDTQLPRDAAKKIIGAMAHPLNHAVYSHEKRRVIDGYGILQPRVSSCIPKKTTKYLRIHDNVSGIDPYTRVSSDVYQDLFREGSFIGKGIYDVKIFEQAVCNVFRENRILSHDLIEGCYARSGLLSDVFLYEEGVARYDEDFKRHHRWIRGDWQISSWILPFIVDGNGALSKNRLSVLSRWKIFDNLRRSLIPISLLLLLLISWSLLPFPLLWTLFVIIILLLPVISATGWQLIHKPIDITVKTHLSEVGLAVSDVVILFLFEIAVLPYEAYKYVDAIIRTNWRLRVTHKKLLEWTPSAVTKNKGNSILSVYKGMWIAPTIGILSFWFCILTNIYTLFTVIPISALWVFAPLIVWLLSKVEKEEKTKLIEEQILFLHKSARKTWSFFENFVTADENWLPPDNFQETPYTAIAHRTSPTNIGLALLANLTAYDFGYISGIKLASKCNNTIHTMSKLDRYKGHFYNWYDTISLLPLQPRYVSTVDSGNLAGHLIILKQGLLDLPSHPISTNKVYEGIRTTVTIIKDFSKKKHSEIIEKILNLLSAAERGSNSLSLKMENLDKLISYADELKNSPTDSKECLYNWINLLSEQIKNFKDDLIQLVPWLSLLPVPEVFIELEEMESIPSLQQIAVMKDKFLQKIELYESRQENNHEEQEWLIKMRTALISGSYMANARIMQLENLAKQCEDFSDMEYEFLENKSTNLLVIGYNVEENKKDNGYYDLLASEERLGIFVAIAQGKLQQKSWFALGRLLTNSSSGSILLSWSGSMFEYLMPQLVMPSYKNTLLYETNKAAIKRQIEYGALRRIPWGISESGYNMIDADMNYQYKAFGVPGLGLKRGLEKDIVIAPYATMLALMISPKKACLNLQLLSKEGFEGEFGFFEAIDYTVSRLPKNMTSSIVRSYMVHHQGMGLLSLAYVLLDKPMQKRFLSEPRFMATLLLLQERVPRVTLFYAHTAEVVETDSTSSDIQMRCINTPDTPSPEIQLIGNGRYQVMVTNSGGGYSHWKGIAVTRWREDGTKDNYGIFCYIKDIDSGKFWSNTYHPTLQASEDYNVVFSQGIVEFQRQDYGINTKTEIVISPEDDIELRRIRLTNKTQTIKTLELTSYAEIVLTEQAADEAHSAFSNLFVQTEIKPENSSIFCTRRPRSAEEKPPWMFHLMDVHGTDVETVSYETDRAQFIGRNKSLVHPQAMYQDLLSGSQGPVLDPIMSIRYRIILKPNKTVRIDMIYGISEDKADCESLMHKYQDEHLRNRAFALSWTHSQILLYQIHASEADAQLYNCFASSVIYPNSNLRAESSIVQNNFKGQSELWRYSISGDSPIVLLYIYDTQGKELARQMIQAHAYWCLKGLTVDLIILNEDHTSYRQVLQDDIQSMITVIAEKNSSYSNSGRIYIKYTDQMTSEDRLLFESVARVIIYHNKGTLHEQISSRSIKKALPPLFEKNNIKFNDISHSLVLPDNLQNCNGIGGFTPNGKEYKIITGNKKTTPAPWVNVIANPDFGTVVSETGSAYTWAVNSHEYRITPWNNDPLCDIGGEAFYLRDEDTGDFWSPSPFPKTGKNTYITTHGFGYTNFEHAEHGISSEMCVFVDKTLPIKFLVLKIKNQSGRIRNFSATGFIEIVMGDLRSKTNMHIISEHDAANEALLIRNRYNSVFSDRVTFFKVNGINATYTADRSEFIGRNRNLNDPQAMYRKKLSGRSGACLDPCAALQVKFNLLDKAEKVIIFQIGNGKDIQNTNILIKKFSDVSSVMQSLHDLKEYWKKTLGVMQINTPDNSLNILANGWLLYQTICCRLFARSGFYQSGGAFGFRDQLQDVLALLTVQPAIAREQILLSASRQFVQGDVQHWWHPPEGRGVRTRCSDDLLWLPFVVSKYIMVTGDSDILTKSIGFLESRSLHDNEDSLYDLPVNGNLSDTLYEHCVRSIKYSLRFGEHGLPLMGSGDWNDGMDRVGNKGSGESVWLAFFMYDVLRRFADTANNYGDLLFSETCKKRADEIELAVKTFGWDGEWFLRAYFDDGTPLGTKNNDECRIDAIAQSWAVLSGAGGYKRSVTAMNSLEKYLVKRDLKLIKLLDPPFDIGECNPGYIKAYLPGVRENGGQYSHAAVWALMAFAALGEREKTWELFNMIQPLNHSSNNADIQVYKVEPYVMAADVYANKYHEGRGGWTWYTGSAGWMYQFIIGSLLGVELKIDKLIFKPCLPSKWSSVSLAYHFGNTTYNITIFQSDSYAESRWEMEDNSGKGNTIKLIDDGIEHEVKIYIGN